MSIDRWLNKTGVVHIHNGILLSYKKERIWVSSNEMDEPRAYYTVKSESQILYINACIWNLERWYWWTYLQGSNGDADTEKTCGHCGGARGKDELTEWQWNKYITTCETATGTCIWCRDLTPGVLWQPRVVGWDERWKGDSRGRRHLYTYDLFVLMYGRNTIL